MPNGEFLSGYFAWAFRDRAKSVIDSGWRRFEQHARQDNLKPKPVPTTRLSHTLGKPSEPGGVKLEVAVRDLPRGHVQHPGVNSFQRDAVNVSWIDLTRDDIHALLHESAVPKELPKRILIKLSKALKDSVRGQCSDWNESSRREGGLYSECVDNTDGTITMTLTGTGDFAGGGRSYKCHLLGRVKAKAIDMKVTEFTLVASGQRTGRDGANDRSQDLGPAPMGVAFKLYDEGD